MSQTNGTGSLDEHVSVAEEQAAACSDNLVPELAGVVAACRDVQSGESVAEELLSINRRSQVLLGLVDDAARAVVFDDVELEIREFPFGIDGLEKRPEARVEVATPRASYVRSVVGEDRLDWVHPRFREE
jgi:hypothetical protein